MPLSLHDVKDAEGFVIATMRRSRIRFAEDEWEDLVQEGLAIMWALAQRYEPRRAGYSQDGRFSGYAARYLPRKLSDAWHRRHPEHAMVSVGGQRSWSYGERALSLAELEPDGTNWSDPRSTETPRGEDYVPELGAEDPELPGVWSMTTATAVPNGLVADISRALHRGLRAEHELTVQVAILKAMGSQRAEIQRLLNAPEIEVRMAMERLRRIGAQL